MVLYGQVVVRKDQLQVGLHRANVHVHVHVAIEWNDPSQLEIALTYTQSSHYSAPSDG